LSGDYHVPEGAATERLDVFLALTMKLSRSSAGRLIKNGAVLVNRRPEKASYIVQIGDSIEVAPAPQAPAARQAPPKLPVTYEDAELLVVDKPAGLTVHPGAGINQNSPTVADFARTKSTDPDADRPGIVHRLDRDTSGLLIIAKTEAAKVALQRQFRARQVQKTYLALVVGHPRPDAATIKLPVGRHPSRPLQQAVVPGGRSAQTRYRTLESYPGYSLIEAHPATGRTHQIRVHFAAIGHPIAGDTTYGPKDRPLSLHRQFLHAAALTFATPTGQTLALESPLPADLAAALAKLQNTV